MLTPLTSWDPTTNLMSVIIQRCYMYMYLETLICLDVSLTSTQSNGYMLKLKILRKATRHDKLQVFGKVPQYISLSWCLEMPLMTTTTSYRVPLL